MQQSLLLVPSQGQGGAMSDARRGGADSKYRSSE